MELNYTKQKLQTQSHVVDYCIYNTLLNDILVGKDIFLLYEKYLNTHKR